METRVLIMVSISDQRDELGVLDGVDDCVSPQICQC